MPQHDETHSGNDTGGNGNGGGKKGCGCGGGGAAGDQRRVHAPVSSEGGGEGMANEAAVSVDQVAESSTATRTAASLKAWKGSIPCAQ